jgi:ABC-type uncharacterized transport system auxiliary subunit
MRTQWKIVRLAAVAGTCLLTACGGLLESGKAARQVYMLQTPGASSQPAGGDKATALVLSVSAIPGIDSDLVQVLDPDAQLSPVANAHWPDHLPEVLSSITRQYLSDTGQFESVRMGKIARPDQWLLELEISAFNGTRDASDSFTGVVLEMEGMLHCNDTNRDLSIHQQSGVAGDSLAALVSAHQQVLDAALRALPGQIIQACAENMQP